MFVPFNQSIQIYTQMRATTKIQILKAKAIKVQGWIDSAIGEAELLRFTKQLAAINTMINDTVNNTNNTYKPQYNY